MSQFLPAFENLMNNEDRPRLWNEVTDNNGGGVIAGINSKFFPEDFARIKSIPQAQRGPAIFQFYQQNFWATLMLGGLWEQDLANQMLDSAVNQGKVWAVKMLQQAVNVLHPNSVAVDCLMGPDTLGAANACVATALIAAFCTARKDRYRQIAQDNPEDAKYLSAWLARCDV